MTISVFGFIVILFCTFMWGFTYRKSLDSRIIEERAKDLALLKFQEWKKEH